MFQTNQAENDRLILAEQQRRQDLIDFAVRRFAPARDGQDVKVIHLYSTNSSLRTALRAICGNDTLLVEHCLPGRGNPKKVIHEVQQDGVKLTLPDRADIVATKTALNKKIEWLAARLCALPVVLPEAADFLIAALEKRRVLVIVGGDQTK
jgi:hypothetical protein